MSTSMRKYLCIFVKTVEISVSMLYNMLEIS